MADAAFDVPAFVALVVVGGVNVGGEKRVGSEGEIGVVEGDPEEDFGGVGAGIEALALGIDVAVLAEV